MAGIDINRTTAGVLLPAAVSGEIWATTQETSAVMQLARQVQLPGSGVTVQTITGEPTAEWVAETAAKPVSRHTLGSKTMRPYKLAVIEPFSNEFRRDLPALYAELVRRLPNALARRFDATVFHGTAPGSDFDVLTAAPAVGITGNTWAGLIAADAAVSAAGGMLTGWALAPQARSILLGETDTTGRPLFVNSMTADGAVPQLLGAPVQMTKAVYLDAATDVLGFAGDWSQASYGTVEGVQVSISDQATLDDAGTPLHLWQRNMFAVRAEIEVGFRVRDAASFVRLTAAAQA